MTIFVKLIILTDQLQVRNDLVVVTWSYQINGLLNVCLQDISDS